MLSLFLTYLAVCRSSPCAFCSSRIADTFKYNFSWSDYVRYIDGWIPKLALSVPIIGYLILFNDKVSSFFVFEMLANENPNQNSSFLPLSSVARLRCLYFGLIFLGISNFIYLWKKPRQFMFGTNLVDYTKTALEIFTYHDFHSIYMSIQENGHRTLGGKRIGGEWEKFSELSGAVGPLDFTIDGNKGWEKAKATHGSLLRGILLENFFISNTSRRLYLSICILLSSLGYILLSIPSFDLFYKVCRATWQALFT